MASERLKILVLFDLASSPPQDQRYTSEDLAHEDWRSEADVFETLKQLGHEPKLFGICNDVTALLDELKQTRYDLVFNLAEAFRGERKLEPNIAALLELLNIPFTGAGPLALRMCKDKALAKKVLSYHGVAVPGFDVSLRHKPLRKFRVRYPAIVKPLSLESSTGISQSSLVHDDAACAERVAFIHERLAQDAIIEEYVTGREIYVSVLSGSRIETFPPRELFFGNVPAGDPKIATFKCKWDDEYRKRWGIENGAAAPIPPEAMEKLRDACWTVCQALWIRGHARIDFRLTDDQTPVFLEANPNPSMAKEDDFAQSAQQAGWSYEKLISKLIAAEIGSQQ